MEKFSMENFPPHITSNNKYSGSLVVPMEQNTINYKFKPPSTSVFLVSQKMVLLKVVLPLNIYRNTKVQSRIDWCKFCIHLRSLNVRHFGMVEAMGLEVWLRDHLQWHDLLTNLLKIHRKLLGDTDGQTDR
jgi:hypothetical protein